MKKNVIRILAVTLTLVMLFILVPAPSASAADASSICKLLDSYTAKSGTFNLTDSSRLYVVTSTEPAGALLQTVQLIQRQFAADGYDNDIVWGPESWAKDGDVLLFVDSSSGIAAEGYQLDVGSKAIIKASDVDGLLYGANMVLKIFRNCESTSIKGFTAADAPDTKERTVQLDIARKYFTKDWICNFIKEMSWMGYNTLSLHFSEDGGFRADFWDPAYYRGQFHPKNDFSWICGSHLQSWVKFPFDHDADADKHLTTAQLVEIINVAKEYHIDIIPSFDSPSHMDYLCWKFERNYQDNPNYSFEYKGQDYHAKDTNGCINYTSTTGATEEDIPAWPYYTTIDINDDTPQGKMAQAFVFALYEDIADFFKEYAGSTDFSIGADEVNLANSKVTWTASQFPGYINELNSLLKGKGYTMRMFNDFMTDLKKFDSDIEVLYWNSPFDPTNGGNDKDYLTVQQHVNNGRILYNCIQTNTYFVLRVTSGAQSSSNTTDARSPDCRSWTFYHSTEDMIYNEWYPADISEHGDKSEDVADVPAAQMGGGYFLLWNDYASVATESQVWNGINTSGKWNVIDRMWSNTIKMWNPNINLAANEQGVVTYDEYKALREKFGYFPSYTSCSKAGNLPTAKTITQAYLADHSDLDAALENKLPSVRYTPESYAEYDKAYNAASALNADHGASEAEMNEAIAALNTAIANLKEVDVTVTIYYKVNVGGTEQTIKTETCKVKQTNYSIYIAPVNGYSFLRCQGAAYIPTPSGDGSGTITGTMDNLVVTLWYENNVNLDRMNYLIETKIEDQTDGTIVYTDTSWAAYQDAVTALENFTVTATTTQAQVDELVRAVEAAYTGLVAESQTSARIISIEKLTDVARLGKQVGLRITTSSDVSSLTITDITGETAETMTICVGKVQTLNNGETVKIWLVHFPADVAGDFTYTLTADEATQNFKITVR